MFIVHAPDCWTWQTEKLGFKKARSDPDSFDLHSTEITMMASKAADWTRVPASILTDGGISRLRPFDGVRILRLD